MTTDEPDFNATIRRQLRPPPGRPARRFLAAWGVEVDDDTDQTDTDNQPPPPAAA